MQKVTITGADGTSTEVTVTDRMFASLLKLAVIEKTCIVNHSQDWGPSRSRRSKHHAGRVLETKDGPMCLAHRNFYGVQGLR